MSALRPNHRLADELGVLGVLEKPFPIESLLRLIAHGCGRSDAQIASDRESEH
jgi:hypothetical protein